MNLDKKSIKAIRGLIVFTAVLILILVNFGTVWYALSFVLNILKPFIYGGAIAFIFNIPMRAIENFIFKKQQGKMIWRFRRTISLLLTIIFVVLLIALVMGTVIPQVIATAADLGRQVPAFMEKLFLYKDEFFVKYPAALNYWGDFEKTELNWQDIGDRLWSFTQKGFGSMLSSTVTVAGNIVNGVVSSFIALVFSFYILVQKEKLGDQCKKILSAYSTKKFYERTLMIIQLAHKNFNNFITGQCLEAVILGTLFAMVLGIFRFPYAIMIGVLIAFTALIPIVGAFIGCFIGSFLILVDSPEKVIWFLITFLVLQQLEGNFIYPKVVGNSVGLPSIWVLAAVTIGGSLMGVAGMLIFIPLISIIYALLREDVNIRNNRQMMQSTEAEIGHEINKEANSDAKPAVRKDTNKDANKDTIRDINAGEKKNTIQTRNKAGKKTK